MPEQQQWGRVWTTARPEGAPRIRQGAWYPILAHGATRVVLDVGGRPVDLPVRLVETRPKQPDRFTVVYRPSSADNPARGTRQDLGKVYAVCPRDATRIRLYGQPSEVDCPTCGHIGIVAWWETG